MKTNTNAQVNLTRMAALVAAGLDPLTGNPMQGRGVIGWRDGYLCDEDGAAMDLSADRDWVFKFTALEQAMLAQAMSNILPTDRLALTPSERATANWLGYCQRSAALRPDQMATALRAAANMNPADWSSAHFARAGFLALAAKVGG